MMEGCSKCAIKVPSHTNLVIALIFASKVSQSLQMNGQALTKKLIFCVTDLF
jgi:hypothetical protein